MRGGEARGNGFVGRSEDLAQFDAAITRAATGEPTTFLVAGEAGVGKTRLVSEWVSRAGGIGAVTLVGSCVQLRSAAVPYAPVVEALRGLVRDLGAGRVRQLLGAGHPAVGQLLPELGAPEPADGPAPWGQGQLFEAVLEMLGVLGSERPVLFVAEDLHWADLATLDLLNFLVRNLTSAGVIIVATMRSELGREHALHTWRAELLRHDSVVRVELGRFGRADLFDLLTARAGATSTPAAAEEIFRRSGGNAFFAEELLATAHLGGALPETLRDTLLGRVASLSRPAQQLLRQVAVAGGPVSHELLVEVSTSDEGALLEALDEAVADHVLVPEADGYAFRHAAFSEAIYAALLPAERRRIHAAYGQALDRHPELGGAAERAGHWSAAGDPERALPWTIEAATQAERQHAPAEAQRHWERALELGTERDGVPGAGGVDRIELLERAAEAANRAGAFDRALALVDTAIGLVDASSEPSVAGHLHQRRGWYLSRSGRDDDALAAYDQTLALSAGRDSSLERVRALASMGRLLARRGDAVAARRCCEEALSGAITAGATAEEGYARHALGLALAIEGEVDAAFDELVQAARNGAATGEVIELAWACLDVGKVASRARRVQEAVDVVAQIAHEAREAGLDRTYGGLVECIAAGGLVELGRWSEADRMTEAIAARGPTGLEAIALDVARGTLAVGLGRFAEAAEHLRAAQGITVGLRDGRLSGLVFDGLAELARWRGRLDEAASAVVEGLAQVANTGDDEMVARLCLTGVRVEADRCAPPGVRRRDVNQALADAGELLATVETLARRLQRPGRPAGEIQAAALTAAAEMERIRGSSASARWRRAAEAWDRLSMPYPEAMAGWRLAEALLAEGDRAEGERALVGAHETAVALGAVPLREGIEVVAGKARVAVLGGTTGPARPSDKHLGLTRREHEVLGVLATGRTNRQIASDLFISEKTVSIHVSRILATLGVATRGEAAAIAHREGLVDDP